MFSDSQILDITCDPSDLHSALSFALGLYGNEMFTRDDARVSLAFRTCDISPGIYLIGTGSVQPSKSGAVRGHGPEPGWTDYPFDYDAGILAAIINQWAAKQILAPHVQYVDGTSNPGLRVRSIYSAKEYLRAYGCDEAEYPNAILAVTPIWRDFAK